MIVSFCLCLPQLSRSGAFRRNFVWHERYLWWLHDSGRETEDFIQLPATHELKKMLPSHRGAECLLPLALASSTRKLVDVGETISSLIPLRLLMPRMMGNLLSHLLMRTSHFSRCGDLESHCVPGAHACRSWGFLACTVTCCSVGHAEADVLPEYHKYKILA